MTDGRDVCDLCGLPLRLGPVRAEVAGKPMVFCCQGCRQVYRMLVEAQNAADDPDPTPFHETALFKECQRMGIIPRSEADLVPSPARESADRSAEAPPPATDREDLLKLTLRLDGMWCPACAWLIDETLKKQPGIHGPSTQFSTDIFQCRYHPVKTSPDEIVGHIRRLGYQPKDDAGGGASEKRRELYRFAISAVFAVNVMMLSFALYSGFFTHLTREAVRYLSWPIFLLAAVPFLYGGWGIHRRAWAGLRAGMFTMESLISAASGSAFFYSLFNLIQGSIHLYFDTASMLITLTLLGKMLERNAKDHVLKDLSALFALKPSKVKRVCDQYPQGRYVSIGMLAKGDLFLVAEGEIVPADGLIIEGEGRVDESSLTGESIPLAKGPGHHIHSGTTLVQGAFQVRAQAVGDDSTMGQMVQVIQRSLGEKTAFEGRTDRLLVVFVPLILGLALVTGGVCWWAGMGFEAALIRSITVMVISCPCALGIAIPLARVAGISMAGRKGILVREFSCFERAGMSDAFVFDKTGTLTEGRYELQQVIPAAPFHREEVLALASGLERSSEHYIAAEIRRCADAEGLSPAAVEELESHGNGISGIWRGRRVRIGSRDFVPGAPAHGADPLPPGDARSMVYVGCDDRLAAVFLFGDRIRPGAAEAVQGLMQRGCQVFLVSGDDPQTTRSVGRRVGIQDCNGGSLPEEKARFIRQLGRAGLRTVMIGDGINDAPALVAADLSMAVYSGPYLGREVADMTLMQSDPRQVLAFLDLAGKVNRKIYQNLVFSGVYNLCSIPIAMLGFLTPLVAVTAMLLSSLTVIGNTLLMIRRNG